MNTEELKESVEWLKELAPIRGKVLIELAESVLQVEGLPEKNLQPTNNHDLEILRQSRNQAIEDCTLIIARDYVKKSSLPNEGEITKIIVDSLKNIKHCSGTYTVYLSHDELTFVAQAIRKLITW